MPHAVNVVIASRFELIEVDHFLTVFVAAIQSIWAAAFVQDETMIRD
jgi:hypothetical protein